MLWLGVVGHNRPNLERGLAALQASAARAYDPQSSTMPPRPHLHLRPHGVDAPPEPAMLGGVLRLNLTSGKVEVEAMQANLLASVSWGMRVKGKLFMGSPWDDGVVVCP